MHPSKEQLIAGIANLLSAMSGEKVRSLAENDVTISSKDKVGEFMGLRVAGDWYEMLPLGELNETGIGIAAAARSRAAEHYLVSMELDDGCGYLLGLVATSLFAKEDSPSHFQNGLFWVRDAECKAAEFIKQNFLADLMVSRLKFEFQEFEQLGNENAKEAITTLIDELECDSLEALKELGKMMSGIPPEKDDEPVDPPMGTQRVPDGVSIH